MAGRSWDGMKVNHNWKRQAGKDGMMAVQKEADGSDACIEVDWQTVLLARSHIVRKPDRHIVRQESRQIVVIESIRHKIS